MPLLFHTPKLENFQMTRYQIRLDVLRSDFTIARSGKLPLKISTL